MNVKTVINPTFDYLRQAVEDIAAHGIPSTAVDIYKGRNRVVTYKLGNDTINIKEFRIPNALNRLIYGHLRPSKASRAFRNALRLLDCGFSTPAPVAYIEITDGPLLGRSYFISIQEPNLTDIRGLASCPRREEITDMIAAVMGRLHSAEIWMKDFSQGNFLWRTGPSGGLEYFLVDINRMDFHTRSRRRLMRNFSTLADDADLLDEIAAAYARHSGSNPEETVKQARKARARYIKKRKRKQRFKQLFRL